MFGRGFRLGSLFGFEIRLDLSLVLLLLLITIAVGGALFAVGFALSRRADKADSWTTKVEGFLAVPTPCCTEASLWDSLDFAIKQISRTNKSIYAIDVPSGLDCDTGVPSNATIRASTTITFVARKIGFRSEIAKAFLGDVIVADIGAPPVIAICRNWPPTK